MPNAEQSERVCKVKREYHKIGGGQEFRYVPFNCQDRSPSGMVHVLGDSHATAYSPMFEQLSAETGQTVSVYSFAGCPFIDFRRQLFVGHPTGCNDFNAAIVQRVREKADAGDILFLPSLRIDRFGDQWASFDYDVFQMMYSPAALKLREDAMKDAKEWMQLFVDQHLHIVFEAPKPIFRAPPFRCSDWFNRHNPICVGNNRQPREALERLRAPIVTSMRELAQTFPGVSIWDPFPVLCPEDICFTTRDGRPLFFDGDHPSAYGNVLLYPDFKAHLGAQLAKP
jgi:hypothetical protein